MVVGLAGYHHPDFDTSLASRACKCWLERGRHGGLVGWGSESSSALSSTGMVDHLIVTIDGDAQRVAIDARATFLDLGVLFRLAITM